RNTERGEDRRAPRAGPPANKQHAEQMKQDHTERLGCEMIDRGNDHKIKQAKANNGTGGKGLERAVEQAGGKAVHEINFRGSRKNWKLGKNSSGRTKWWVGWDSNPGPTA